MGFIDIIARLFVSYKENIENILRSVCKREGAAREPEYTVGICKEMEFILRKHNGPQQENNRNK